MIQTHFKKKIAAKRRIKASQGMSETLTGHDMEQLANALIKTLKENTPDDVVKPVDYNDVVKGLKEGGTAELLGFRVGDLNAHNDTEVQPAIPYQGVKTQEAVTEEFQPPIEASQEAPMEENVTEEVPIEEVTIEETVVETPVEIPVEKPKEPELTSGVGNVGQRIADEFKPLTPFIGPINPTVAPIPAPMPAPYPNSRPAVAPAGRPNNTPQLGTEKFWDNDTKFW